MKNKFGASFLLTLLLGSHLFAVELKPYQQDILNYTAISSLLIGAYGLGAYAFYSYNLPEDFYVKNEFPYAQAWYDEMAEKYPSACLKEKRFLGKSRFTDTPAWESTFHEIYATPNDLKSLNQIYEKKEQGIELVESEIVLLHIFEFLLLHEVAHIENNDIPWRILARGGFILTLENLFALYTEEIPSFNPLKRLKNPTNYATVILSSIAYYNYVRYQEARADKFACDHAETVDVLEGGVRLFDYLTKFYTENELLQVEVLIDPEHPSSQSRAQAVRDEITRRLEQRNQ